MGSCQTQIKESVVGAAQGYLLNLLDPVTIAESLFEQAEELQDEE